MKSGKRKITHLKAQDLFDPNRLVIFSPNGELIGNVANIPEFDFGTTEAPKEADVAPIVPKEQLSLF